MDQYLTYDAPNRAITIETDDRDLLADSPYPYKLRASLTNFPAVSEEAEAHISLVDPCISPTSLTVTPLVFD